jgi:hypothetical protein
MLNNFPNLIYKKKIFTILGLILVISFLYSFVINSSNLNQFRYETKAQLTKLNTHSIIDLELKSQTRKIQTQFVKFEWPLYLLFTWQAPKAAFILNTSNINTSLFDYSLRTYLIIHGFISQANTTWIKEIKDNILNSEIVNVIVVDWSEASKYAGEFDFSESNLNPKQYIEAVENAKLLGIKISKFITLANINTKNVHCIGHSLGAHSNLCFDQFY